MEHQDLAQASAVLGALGAPLVVLARERLALLAGTALLLAAEIGLAYALVPDAPRLVTESALRLGSVFALGLAVVALGALIVRFPAVAPVLLLVAAPFRISVGLGSEEASLLLPLYVVLIAAAGALVYRALRSSDVPTVPFLLAGPAAALVGLAGLSLLWATDPRAGTIELLFFYFPFAAVLGVVARTRPVAWSGRALAAALLTVTGLLAAIGIYQAWSHSPLLAKDAVQLANARAAYFRVTSLFEDPSVYGRHLVLGITVALALLWLQRLRPAVGVPVLVLLAAGLYFSYSQTSLLALFVAVLAIGLIAGDTRSRRILAGTAVAVALAGTGLFLATVEDHSASRFTSDRLPLARITLPVYADHPIAGVGIGSQPLASREEAGEDRRKTKSVSHTTPLTVAAELGTLGLLAYIAFLLGTGRALVLLWARQRALGLVLTACLAALVAHSLFYAAFFEDPFVWGLVGLAAAALALQPQWSADLGWLGTRRTRTRAKPLPGSPGR
jgi:hypothetical protein